MSNMISVTGTVSGTRTDTSISVSNTTTVNTSEYSPTTTSSSQTTVEKSMCFRIDNRPANMAVAINLTNGDMVTAAGFQKGEFEVLALNNHTTRTMYWVPEPPTYPEIIYMIVGVIVLMFHKIGWLVIGGAILFLMNKKKKINLIRQAKAMVEKAPAKTS